MRGVTALFVICFVGLGSIARASEPGPGPLAAAAAREAQSMMPMTVPFRLASHSAFQPPTQQRRWISRHPIKAGALIGAGVGLAWGVAFVATDIFEQDSSTPGGASHGGATLVLGPLLGATAGAIVGVVVWAVR